MLLGVRVRNLTPPSSDTNNAPSAPTIPPINRDIRLQSVHYAKSHDRSGAQCVSRTKDRRRKRGVIRRVGIVLRLEHDPAAVRVRASAFPFDRSVKKVARVELKARF